MQLDKQGHERESHSHGGLLWQRTFRLLWIGETISQLGNAMGTVGVPLVAVPSQAAGICPAHSPAA
jgi:hypothetical protein